MDAERLAENFLKKKAMNEKEAADAKDEDIRATRILDPAKVEDVRATLLIDPAVLAARTTELANDGSKAVLRVACAGCGTQNDSDAKFCKSCGATMAAETGIA
jgi:hypothetical protein